MEHRHMRISDAGWAHGVYTLKAITSSRNRKYPEEPLKLWGGQPVDEDGKPLTDADRFEAWAMAFNARFQSKQEPVNEPQASEPKQ